VSNLENHPYYYHYQIDKQKFSTKLFALYAREKLQNKHITWHFPNWENALSKIDLIKEPEESLQDLYLQRAIQLRNQYDYLILYYSGGEDSNQILETFMLNDIFLDEIVIFEKYDNKFKDNVNDNFEISMLFSEFYESSRSAIPQAKFYTETFSPKTKITVVNNIFELNQKYWKNLDRNDLKNHIQACNLGINSRILFRSKDLSIINSKWKSLLNNKKVGHIYGKEKVKLSHDDIGFFIYMNDVNVVEYIDLYYLTSYKNLPNNMELFYVHPDFVKIQIKQSHEIIKKIPKEKISSSNSPIFLTREIEDLFSNVIYTRKYKRLYTGLKPLDYTKILIKDKNLSKKELLLTISHETGEKAVKFYLKEDEKDASSNYYNFVSLVRNSFFSQNKLLNMTDLFLTSISTKKYYVKYFKNDQLD
jgi:hypothetical protein